jgi:hypothetical protein
VVTEYTYYPLNDPTGSAGSTPGPDGEGLRASMTRDVRQTPTRATYLPGVALAPLTTTWRYNDLGDLAETVDPLGLVTRRETSRLHALVRLTEDAGAPKPVVTRFRYDEDGNLAYAALEQPGAGAAAGGPRLVEKWERDRAANTLVHTATREQGADVVEKAEFDANDDLTAFRPGDVVADPASASWTGFQPDERGRPAVIREGAGNPVPLETRHRWSASGNLAAVETPAALTTTVHEDGFAVPAGVTGPAGRVVEALPDSSAQPDRHPRRRRPAFPGPG